MVANARKIAAWTVCAAAFPALLSSSGCRPSAVRSSTELPANASQTQSPSPAAVNRPAGAQVLRIDPAGTVVTVIVRRAGPLARLGHDHVITSADETGTVWLGATPAESSFELQLPVDRFAVDLPEARAAVGAEFATPVPDDAREGTRRNMLRTEVLDAAQYPAIVIRSVATAGDWLQANVRVVVVVKGVEREQEIPVAIERGDGRVVASGSLQLNQTDFGMTPFSVGGGAIQVADTLEIRFEIVADRP